MRDAIAIVGMGCRFPGANSPQAFWQLLTAGKSSIQEIPGQRWKKEALYDPDPTRPGKTTSCWGGFIDQVDQFDWRAFRLLPQEAEAMDPEHRLLLEVAWEALEDAGLPFSEVAGSCTSVFVGVGWSDYLRLQTRNWSEINGYTVMGNESSFAAHRLSYAFDLKGPSVALDTGCISSLTSLYLACQSLWAQEADLALAGGVSLLLSPETYIMASKAGLLAPDGRCKAFDAHANGFVLGEGAGILVLKPFSQVKSSDRVYALIQGISSNHNGHNEWIVATSQAAQEELLRTTYQRAAVDPVEVDYVELHGTGFLRGDSVEANALGAVLGVSDQRAHPCLVGSVKTNIGHLGAAAGVASVIKVALALFHREIPPTLNLNEVSPLIDLQRLQLDLPTQNQAWPEKKGAPLAAVSTFSLAGANAHAVLTASSTPTRTVEKRADTLELLPLSAHTQEALHTYAASFRDFLQKDTAHMAWPDICYTASVRRTHRPYRLAITGQNAREAAQALDAFLQQEQPDREKKREASQLIFAFVPVLPQKMWKDSECIQTEKFFQAILHESEHFTQKYAGTSVIEEISQACLSSSIDETFSPLASFVLQIALAEHWRSWGIIPEIASGNGWGALAAAYIAGVITLEEAISILLSATANGKTAHSATETSASQQRTTRCGLYTGNTGFLPKGTLLPALPWGQNISDLNLSDALQQFEHSIESDILVLEFGPPWLSAAHRHTPPQGHNSAVRRVSLIHQESLSKEALLHTLGLLYMQGFSVHWPALYDEALHCVTLPSFPWQRETAWPGWLDPEIISTPPEHQNALLLAKTQTLPASAGDLSSLPLEEALAIIWAETLALKRVEVHGNFFELGGHSLLAAQLITRIQTVFHAEISLDTLLHAPTPATCAQAIQQQQRTDSQREHTVSALPTIKNDVSRRHEPFALTDVQLAYWVGRNIPLGSDAVGNHGYIEVEADGLDIARFNRAMQQLIQRHEMLRAVLFPGGQQRILETVPLFEATIVDLQDQDTQEAAMTLQHIRREMDHQLLSVEQWPAFDIRLILLAQGHCQIHLSVESLFVDAWSMHLLIREFIHLYYQPDIPLAGLELSFRDYILAERSLRETELYQRSEHYWKQRVDSLPPAPDLPLTNIAIPETPLRFVHHQARLAAKDWGRLKARAAEAGLTPSGILLAAFAEILGAWSKSSRFSINISLFNRLPLHPQVHDIVGDFTSLTVFAIDNTTREPFEKRARRVQEQLWKDLDHSYYNGIHVLRELASIQGNMAEAVMPIVFTSLLIQDTAYPSPTPWQEVIYSLSQTPQVWLDHQVLESQGALVSHWQVIEELFPEGYIEAMFGAYTSLLQRLATEEDLWQASSLQLLPREQLEQCVHEPFVLQDDCLLQDLFTRQVYKQPASIAVVTPDQKLSYGEVYGTALSLAERLKRAGAKRGHFVGVVLEKGWRQVVAVLGILYAGAAYVPIDPELPAERLHYLLAHGEVELVVTQAHLDDTIAWPTLVQRLCLDDKEATPAPLPEYLSIQKPEDLAYLIYTSGSTGTPKGVMIDHRSVVNTILDINERFAVNEQDRVLAISALSFDLSVYDIFGTLAAGGTIVLPSEETAQDPTAWLELLMREQVTLWNSVPTLLQLLLECAETQALSLQGSRLRLALLSGDWIPLTLPERLHRLLPAIQLISLGGATEASIWSIFYPIEQVQPSWKSIPYGRPLRNQRWYILNDRLDPCPTWVPGHLYIAGLGLAQGYWHDEEKTRASFLTHPDTGERLYKTGDLGRYLPDGLIEFLGREDFQVKVQGHRIELGEIEAAFLQHPLIHKSIVIALGERYEAKRLVAYFVSLSNQVHHSELRQFLAERLPAYMLPSSFVQLEQLPLTANGKVDRKALPIPEQYEEVQKYLPLLEEAGLAARVAHILKQALNVEQIDPSTNILEYGATSLDILHIANMLQSQLAVRLSPRSFYKYSTLATLVQYCEQYLWIHGTDELQAEKEKIGVLVAHDAQDWEEGSL